MGSLIKYTLITALILGCTPPKSVQVENMPQIQGISTKTLGPQTFEFCGGNVTIWVQVNSHSYGTTDLFLKVSPPKNQNWEIWNAHIIVEKPSEKDEPVRFENDVIFNTAKEKSRVISFEITRSTKISNKGLKVALKPFKGCQTNQKIMGSLLN